MINRMKILVIMLGTAGLVGSSLFISGSASANQGKVLLCHKTASDTNPWVVQSVNANEVQSHLGNGDFLYSGSVDVHGHPTDTSWCQNQPTSSPSPTASPSPTPSCLPFVLLNRIWQEEPTPCPSPTTGPSVTPSASPVLPPDTGTSDSSGGWQAPTCADAIPPTPSQVTVTGFSEAGGVMTVHWIPTVNPSTPLANIYYQVPNGATYSAIGVANTGVFTVHFQPDLTDVFYVSVAQNTGCAVSQPTGQVLVQTPAKQAVIQGLGSK